MTIEFIVDIALLCCFAIYAVLASVSWWLEKKRQILVRRRMMLERQTFERLVADALADPRNPEKKLKVTMMFLNIIMRDPMEGIR